MIKIKMGLIAIIVIITFVGSANSENLPKTPKIENISEALATNLLEENGLKADFQRCFSNTVEKHIIIPGSQDPQEGIEWFKNGTVHAVVSLGPFQTVIGKSKEKAIETINNLNLIPLIIEGRNNSVRAQYVYDQDPLPVEDLCIPQGTVVKLYVNSSSRVIIDSPEENDIAYNTTFVRGRLLDPLSENEHLWIAVKSISSIGDWWPQNTPTGSSIIPVDGKFDGFAYLGGMRNDSFEIAVIIVDNETNEKIMEWINISRSRNTWPSITEGYPKENLRVPKEAIERQEKAKVIVRLSG